MLANVMDFFAFRLRSASCPMTSLACDSCHLLSHFLSACHDPGSKQRLFLEHRWKTPLTTEALRNSLIQFPGGSTAPIEQFSSVVQMRVRAFTCFRLRRSPRGAHRSTGTSIVLIDVFLA
jgi:hypothetical protein